MTKKYSILVCCVALLLVLSGCPESGSGGAIGISGEMNATDDGFQLSGTVSNSGYADVTHDNVTVYLYTANGTLLAAEKVGNLSRPATVEMETDRIPKYVIVNSPGFWEYDNIDVTYYEHVVDDLATPPGIYSARTIGSKDEFPVEVPD